MTDLQQEQVLNSCEAVKAARDEVVAKVYEVARVCGQYWPEIRDALIDKARDYERFDTAYQEVRDVMLSWERAGVHAEELMRIDQQLRDSLSLGEKEITT